MAIKVKSKKAPKGTGHPRKKATARHEKKARPDAETGWRRHATTTLPPKPLLARKPKHATARKPLVSHRSKHATPPKTLFTHKPKLVTPAERPLLRKPPREFVVATEPMAGSSLPIRKKKKKAQLVLRFTENTLKDIAALECVRRCFNK